MRFAWLLVLCVLLGCAHEDRQPAATGLPRTTTTTFVDHAPPHYVPSTTTTTARPRLVKAKPRVVVSPVLPVTDDIWWKLAGCETGYRYDYYGYGHSENGYYGFFQFDLPSWRGAGGTGVPTDYSYEEQKEKAIVWQRMHGWGKWPRCARQLGLL